MTTTAEQIDLRFVEEAIECHGREPDACIPILQALQEHYRYLPEEALRRVCDLTHITPAQIAGVSSFYTQFRHRPRGAHLIRVCCGTACHVRGAELVQNAIEHHLRLPAGEDTSSDKRFTVEKVACLGCCTLAPVVQIDSVTYGHVLPGGVPKMLRDFTQLQREAEVAASADGRSAARSVEGDSLGEIRVGLGSCCMVKGSDRIYGSMRQTVRQLGIPATVKRVGCVGACHNTPIVEVVQPGRQPVFYARVSPEQAPAIVRRHFRPRGVRRLTQWFDQMVETLFLGDSEPSVDRRELFTRDPRVTAFMGPQIRISTEHFGLLDPLDFDEYAHRDGFAAMRRVMTEWSPQKLIDELKTSGLRGRGGAGFPTGLKWELARAAAGEVKYVICNGDEGDPGAFMDRMLLESFPYRIIEGLVMAAWAIGAHEGFFYIRAEYPLAVQRMRQALAECEKRGVLGNSVLGSGYAMRLQIKEGAGAFVCGEETALIESLEGQRGMPRWRPPYPVESGLWGRPTVVNNVETLSLLPWIVRHGAAAFAAIGAERSKGTKVFALAGKIVRGGLIEVPMGISIRGIVEEIGGGCPNGRELKAVQIGGPSGGCVPARLCDTPIDFEQLSAVGTIMGSGGLVVLDSSDCMVDIARYFLSFTQDQSCGECTFCRVGTKRMLQILERLCAGQGKTDDLDELENLARHVQAGSICGLGKTAPNPVLTTLRYFRHEYEAHIAGRCPAGRCKSLIKYSVTDACIGCTLCAQACPAAAIPYTPYRKHYIDMNKCTRCDTCRNVCPVPTPQGAPTGGAILIE